MINLDMLNELNEAWSEVEDIGAQVVVLTGAGKRAFSAGVDVAITCLSELSRPENVSRLVLRICDSDCIGSLPSRGILSVEAPNWR